jgi:hypothetical protein
MYIGDEMSILYSLVYVLFIGMLALLAFIFFTPILMLCVVIALAYWINVWIESLTL